MDESEKRRERLKAMRMEASAAELHPSSQFPAETGALSNPLVETPIVQESQATTRFDYYTDPMAAYSGNKRQNNFTPSSRGNPVPRGGGGRGRGSPVMQFPPPPPLGPRPGNLQMTSQSNYVDPRMQHGGISPFYGPGPNYVDPRMQHDRIPPFYGPGPVRSPMRVFNPRPDHQHQGFSNQPNPRPDHQHQGFSNQPYGHYPGNSQMPRPGFQWVRAGSPSPGPATSTGRGRSTGHWTNNGPNPGGRGVGYRGDPNQQNLYRKSMVEDPWKNLKPVFWRALSSTKSLECMRNLSDAKKPMVEESIDATKTKGSLADYLAAAFEETVEGGTDAL